MKVNFLGVVSGVDVFGGSSYGVLVVFRIFPSLDFEIWGAGVWDLGWREGWEGGGRGVG